jgi:hypothetical protein
LLKTLTRRPIEGVGWPQAHIGATSSAIGARRRGRAQALGGAHAQPILTYTANQCRDAVNSTDLPIDPFANREH